MLRTPPLSALDCGDASVVSTPKLDVLNDLKSSTVVFALSSQYYLLIQSTRRYVTEFRSGALAEHVVTIDVRLERKIVKNCAKSV